MWNVIEKMLRFLVASRPTFCARTAAIVLALRTSRRACQTARSHLHIGATPPRERYSRQRGGNCGSNTNHERLPVLEGRRAPCNQRIYTPQTTHSTNIPVHISPQDPPATHLTSLPEHLHPHQPAKYLSSHPGVPYCPAQTPCQQPAAHLSYPHLPRH